MPLIGLDVLVLYYLEWGSQLYMTCAESGGIAFISGLFIIFDNCCICTRLSNFEEREVIKQKKLAKAKAEASRYKTIDQSKDMLMEAPSMDVLRDMIDLEEEAKKEYLYRENLLKNILKTVKNNKKLQLNGDGFDYLLWSHRSGGGEK